MPHTQPLTATLAHIQLGGMWDPGLPLGPAASPPGRWDGSWGWSLSKLELLQLPGYMMFFSLYKEGWNELYPSTLPPPPKWISCLFQGLDWQRRRLRPSVSTWAGGQRPSGWFGACFWSVGTDRLWGRERKLSEGPVRSSPSFALLFPVCLGLGGGAQCGWGGGRLCLSTLRCCPFFHEDCMEGGSGECGAWQHHGRGPKFCLNTQGNFFKL